MIAFGLRLTLRGGREAAVRLVITAAAVALGVGLLLVTLAGINAVHAQNARYAWLNSGVPEATAGAAQAPDPVWGTVGLDLYDGRPITRVDVAVTGPRPPVPPGLRRLPGPGEYFASPALRALLRSVPATELGDRYPGREAGAIGAAALPGPDALIIIVGHRPAELSHVPGVARVTGIATKNPGDCAACRYGIDADAYDLVLSVTAAALLFPILVFIGTATRLAATRREQRFAAMRLVGATPRQVSVVTAVESAVAALLGTAAGFGVFFLLRAPLAAVPFTGEPFYPGDLSLGAADVPLVAIGVPLAAVVAARIALRRVRISPLGVSRRVTPPAPRAYRLIPLIAGIGELTYFVGRRPATTGGQTQAYLTGILLMMAGLVIAGPWLTMAGSRIMARRARRPAALIAARRLADNPYAGFRAISGLVLALFVTTTAVEVMTTMVAERGAPRGDATASGTLMVDFAKGRVPTFVTDEVPLATVPDSVEAGLRSLPGVTGVLLIHPNPLGTKVPGRDIRVRAGLVSCAQLAGMSGFGRCAAGAQAAAVPPGLADLDGGSAALSTKVWPAAAISPERLRRLPAERILVATNGSKAAIERARVALVAAFHERQSPVTISEFRANTAGAKELAGYQQLVNVVILASLCVAGCGLAVGVVAGLTDRKRPFSLLRLSGVPLGMLRRIVTMETAVPLLITAMVATGAGALAAQLFLKSQMNYDIRAPGGAYFIAVIAGLAASLGVIASTLPLLKHITGPQTARNE